ncbi:MAG: sensor domain-containing diguanylate cyclase [Peptococcia bacterium]|jgi:diguanylate cyclase (GGDEF)-like protein
MPKKEKFRKIINAYLLLFCLFTAVIGLILFSVLSFRQYKNICFANLENIRDRQLNLIENWFGDRSKEIRQLSQDLAAKDTNLKEIKEIFQHQLNCQTTCFNALAYADKEGSVLLVEGELENPEVSVADQEYYQLALQGNCHISETIISRFNGKYTIAVCSPVLSEEGEMSGLIIGSINIEKIERMLTSIDPNITGNVYLLDKNGTILTVPYYTLWPVKSGTVDKTGQYRYQLKEGAALGLTPGESGYSEYDNYQAKRVFGAYKAMENYGWSLAVEVDKAETMGAFWRNMAIVSLVYVSLFFLLIVPLLKRATWRLIKPIEATVERAVKYAEDCGEKGTTGKWEEEKFSIEEVSMLNQVIEKMHGKIDELSDKMRVQALYDPLTGLANRRHFYARGQEIVELVRRKSGYCSLVYFDIDGFKNINDLYGNNIGDQVLVFIAEVLGRIARISDVAGRLAGEEFAVILPETDGDGALQFAERFKKYVAEAPVEVDYHSFGITISIGVATYKSFGCEKESSSQLLETLINRSLEAMEKAKENGGNRVESFSE